jgi:hypothetical protein
MLRRVMMRIRVKVRVRIRELTSSGSHIAVEYA